MCKELKKIEMGNIQIKRKKELFAVNRKYEVFIDGQLAGKIKSGEVMEFSVDDGQHIVEVKMDWHSSIPVLVNVESKGLKKMIVGGSNFTYNNHLIGIAIVAIVAMLRLSLIACLIFLLLSLIGVFAAEIVGRKKHLTLEEL